METTSKEKTLITVVTPVYNGERFIRTAYECLCRQSHTDWEWSVVDDGSIDGSLATLQRLAAADSRIIVGTQPNSGAAKMPRDHAVYQSKDGLILPLDIDDTLEDDYLQKMLKRLVETQADIVYPEMQFVEAETGKVTQTLPVAGFDRSKVYGGRELVRHTMPDWEIGCNGGLYRREAWLNMSYPEHRDPVLLYSDEVDERIYLIHARRVAFADAKYHYINHAQSITTRISPKRFHLLKNTAQLLDICEETFGKDSEEYKRANTKLFYNWRWMTAEYIRHHRELEEADGAVVLNLRTAFDRIDASLLTRSERVRFLNLCSFSLIFALFCLKYSPRLLLRKTFMHFMPTLYRWIVIRRATEGQIRSQLAACYQMKDGVEPCKPFVVSMFCGNTASGGLIDRLRGAVSVFLSCQETHRDFKLHFTHPFPLTDYLVPADYDWRVNAEEVSFDPRQTEIVVCDSQAGTLWEERHQRRYIENKLKHHPDRQIHCYTNAPYCYKLGFADAFRQLFKPAPTLSRHIDEVKAAIGGSYITVSARFCNLLDDFNEEVYGEPLGHDEREALLDRCLSQLRLLKERHTEERIVVCSDSTTFLRRASETCGAYSVPGNVSHIGNDSPHDYAYYEKTFLDFFVISQAAHVYLLLAEGMHRSGFPYAAALTGNRPYDIICI